ncbi:hypothetical protein [Actinomadura macra]|uniref:hypothetical protein n=1 Tax=Actinomadura macra TaxID=46164 RepID=UPI0008361BD5|nr:hypothetical protein [Actinomadura macra]
MTGRNEIRRALSEDFPTWLIEVSEEATLGVRWQAGRALAPGHGGIIGMCSDNHAMLRELLDETDAIDSRHAIRDLAAGLRERDITAHVYGTTLLVTGLDAREQLITCKRGLFRWASDGREIGPIVEMRAAIEQIARDGQ